MPTSFAIGVLALAALAFLGMVLSGGRRGRRRATNALLPGLGGLAGGRDDPAALRGAYAAKPLLSAWERRALLSMRQQTPAGFYVCPQVRLADMLAVTVANETRRLHALRAVASKSVDFAVVELATGAVVLVVELDDRSHLAADRQRRDALVDAALAQGGIPIRRFRPDTAIHIRDFFAAAGLGPAAAVSAAAPGPR